MLRKLACLAFFFAAAPLLLADSTDWPQWRGPSRDASAPACVPPAAWPKTLQRKWKVKVGQGHSGPVVSGKQVFVLCRQDNDEIVRGLDLADGHELWSQKYSAPYEMSPYARGHGPGPKSTPVVADGRLLTLGIGGILSCWETSGGRRLWQQQFTGQFKNTSPLYGTAMSLLVDNGRVIAHVGGNDQGALMAFDLADGAPRWRWADDGPGYASPIIATLDGTRQLITQSQKLCIALSPDDGRLLWSIPFETEYVQNIITPIVAGPLVIFSGTGKGVTAYRPAKTGPSWQPHEQWHTAEVSFYMSSPILVGDRLFGLAQQKRGEFCLIDSTSGKVLWTGPPRAGQYTSIVAIPGHILTLADNGGLTVWKLSAQQAEPVARYTMADGPTWAHLAVVGRGLLVKDLESLALWTLP